MNTLSLRRLLWRSMWGVMALVCGVFSLSAAEFYWVTVTQQTPSYATFLAWTVSDEFAFGTQSGFAQMTPYWRNMPAFNQVVLGSHAVLASLALVIGAVQFHPRIRMRWPSIHRWGGRVYASTTLVAMILAMVYLGLTPTEHIYGGAPFAAGLWGIAVLTTYTLLASWAHIVRGERVAHQTTMVLNFAAMLIAPLLRFWWMALGWMFEAEGWSQETAHVAVLMFLGLQVVVGAIAVLHLQRRNLTVRPAGPSNAFATGCSVMHHIGNDGSGWRLGVRLCLSRCRCLHYKIPNRNSWIRMECTLYCTVWVCASWHTGCQYGCVKPLFLLDLRTLWPMAYFWLRWVV